MTTQCDLFRGSACPAVQAGLRQPEIPPWRRAREVAVRAPTRRFERDQEIFGEGDAVNEIYEVVSGAVRTYKLLSDGRRQIDAFHLPGDLFGMEEADEHRFSAEAVGEVTVRALRWHGLERLSAEDPATAGRVMGAMARSLGHARDHMMLLGRKCALEKVASFLLGFVDRAPAEETVELPMSRADIADHLGLTIETVSRTLTDLRRRGIIDLPTTRRAIVLRDLDALCALDTGDGDDRRFRAVRRGASATVLAA